MAETCININNITPSGTANNRPYWIIDTSTLTNPDEPNVPDSIKIIWQNFRWECLALNPSTGNYELVSKTAGTRKKCPTDLTFTYDSTWLAGVLIPKLLVDCGDCETIEERIFKEYQAIKIPTPSPTINYDEPFKCCDERLLMLASTTESESYKNDITSAWIKLSSASDTVTFKLTKDGVNTTYTPTPVAFPSEDFAFYTTIHWRDVLGSDGEGCYKLELEFNIGGIASTIAWGIYQLKTWSLKNADKTARLRAKFNLKQSIEGINFTNANVEDTIRFYGFIGNRQPNMEIDNLIYSDRVVKTVVRENLNTYEINTDPYTDTLLNYLIDLVLLSENELYISDYNSFNHSHKILDLPVIVQDSPEVDYLEQYQRKAVLTCIVGDRNKNKRTFF